MTKSNKPVTQAELRAWLENVGSTFRPVTIRPVLQIARKLTTSPTSEIDALVQISWDGQTVDYVAELKSLWTPKAIRTAIESAATIAKATDTLPLIVVPYLSEESLLWLEEAKVSGLDLCGNGLLEVPGKLLVRKSGAPNKFRGSAKIQNIYRGSSSLVARAFLLKPRFGSTRELLAEILARGGEITLPTVSKVCSVLADDLIIERESYRQSKTLLLLQPDKLIDALAKNYVKALITGKFVGVSNLNGEDLMTQLKEWTRRGESVVRTGADSTQHYVTMAREPIRRFYCTNLSGLVEFLGSKVIEEPRFPTLEFSETRDPNVYFDARQEFIASPVQCYLELQSGDKRDQQTAIEVRKRCLKGVDQ